MGNKKSGLLVVVFNNDGGNAIAEWFEYSREQPDEVVNLLKYMRKKYNAYWWGEYKMFRQDRNVTLTQSTKEKPDYEGKFRKMKACK
ncbi:hypothetical protein H6A66_14595 [Bacteroides caecigallinarum]|uniref:hypothetical protein n=1 Tax=Bacteroides caecigallinarum TaxID=1411144 RepID=UPI001957FF70|nr:hypothetical protein [Bacteroides caecigallinarum]MBM6866386.1 hypothetical protein [Bacteroides caecigallinarum]